MSTNLMCADLISIDDDSLAQWLLFLEVFEVSVSYAVAYDTDTWLFWYIVFTKMFTDVISIYWRKYLFQVFTQDLVLFF